MMVMTERTVLKKKLIKHIRENLAKYESRVLQAIKPYSYEKERHGINFSIAVGATLDDVDMASFSQVIRLTDTFVFLDENVCGVVFGFNDTENGIKAASNLLNKFELKFFSNKIYLGIISSEDESSPEKQVKKLFETLCHGIQHGMSNIPLDYQHIAH